MVSEISRMTELGEKKIRELVRSFDNDELYIAYDEIQNQMYERFGRINEDDWTKSSVADNKEGSRESIISKI